MAVRVMGCTVILGPFGGDRAAALVDELTLRGRRVVQPPGSTPALLAEAVASKPSVVVLDGHPAALELRALAKGLETEPDVAVLVIGPLRPLVEVLVALASGVTGYLPPGTGPVVAADTVSALCAGEVVLPKQVLHSLGELHRAGRGVTVDRADGELVELTPREWEVFVLVRQAYTTREIAERLVVATVTVRTHVAALVHKLGVDDRSMLTRPITDRRP
jgi:DNA-binding NarL/FixJ family response regulator